MSLLRMLTDHPLPYPVLLILVILSFFVGTMKHLSSSFVLFHETPRSSCYLGWLISAMPIAILLTIHCLSAMEEGRKNISTTPVRRRFDESGETRKMTKFPWKVAAFVGLVLGLARLRTNTDSLQNRCHQF